MSGRYLVLLFLSLKVFVVKAYHEEDTLKIPLADTFHFIDNLFSESTELELTLRFDIRAFQKGKKDEGYLPAQLIVTSEGKLVEKKVRVKSRGTSRKHLCSFPPYWLNIQRTKKKDKGYKVNYKVKVVTHCKPGRGYSDYLMREYLAYKIYNLITPYSFKTRLVRFNYIDAGRKDLQYSQWGFIIEDTDHFAKRTSTREIRTDNIGFRHTQLEQTDLLSMFALMIGNTDWSVTGRQNIKVFQPGSVVDQEKLIAVPYDFDYSGFVGTHYALPTEGLGNETVRERVFVGPCREWGNYLKAINVFKDKKESIYELIHTFEYLSQNSKKELIKYLESFYDLIENYSYISVFFDQSCSEIGGVNP